jgi:RND family efflux transporter MFP subunit
MRRLFLFTAAAAAVAAAAVPVHAQGGMPPTLVETAPVISREFHDQITLVGRSEAQSNSAIVSEVAGRVTRVDAAEGNPVARGAVLVSIDSRRIRYQLDAVRAQVAQAHAAAELAEKNLARTQDLHKRDLAADGALDADLAEHTRTAELYNQLVAQQKQLELDLENCTIRSPFDGYTVRKLVDVGEGVGIGTPVYEVVNLNTIKVTIDLPERYFGHVRPGSDAHIQISASDEPVVGKITGFAPSASRETHTFPVIITVDNREHLLGGGMLVRATISLDKVFTSLAVHKDAIVRQGPKTMVYTIADGKAAPIPVKTGSMEGNMIAVSGDGITEGMPVVVRGNERIFPGSPVRTGGGAPDSTAQPGGEGGEQTGDAGGDTGSETAKNE